MWHKTLANSLYGKYTTGYQTAASTTSSTLGTAITSGTTGSTITVNLGGP